MVKRIRKHSKVVLILKKSEKKEKLHSQKNNFPLNKAQIDRISFSVLRNEKNNIRKIENISYEININDKWEWILRYDDHGGKGSLHGHLRISLAGQKYVEISSPVVKYKTKEAELSAICNLIDNNYLNIRTEFVRNNGLDLY